LARNAAALHPGRGVPLDEAGDDVSGFDFANHVSDQAAAR
jgi:hypothetical protein